MLTIEPEPIPLGQQRHDLLRLVQDIKSACYANVGRIAVVEVLGALEMAKIEIFQEQS